jgi:hypothetical protein
MRAPYAVLEKAMKTNLGIAFSFALVEVILEIVRSDFPTLLQDFNRWENKVNWTDEPYKPIWLERILNDCFMHLHIGSVLKQQSAEYEEKVREYGNALDANIETSFIIANEIMNLEETKYMRNDIKRLLDCELICKTGGRK